MAQIRPFSALLPPSAIAAQISCPPYDVVNAADARRFIAKSPNSFMRIIRPEAEWSTDISPYAGQVYARARENLALFQRQAWLQPQPVPGIFIYRLRDGQHAQTGVVACCAVDEYDSGLICRHENTKPEKENDRTQHTLALSAHPEPVLLAYRGEPAIDALVENACRTPALFDFVAEDGVRHTLWSVPLSASYKARAKPGQLGNASVASLIEAFEAVPRLYIADGHHRSASAYRVREARRAQNPQHNGTEKYNFFPAVLFPAAQLRILAYNRVLRGLSSWQPEEFLARLHEIFQVRPLAEGVPQHQGEFAVYCGQQWHSFILRPEASRDPVAKLDLSRLQKQVLEPFFGLADQRTDPRVDFVGGKNSVAVIQNLVDCGEAQLGLSLFPPLLAELFAVSDGGELMPPKSTWFEPKLRSGLFLHPF